MSHNKHTLANLHLDFETAGLDERMHDIVDVGIVGTTADLNTIFEFTSLVHATPRTLTAIASQPIVHQMMSTNGLLERLITGSTAGSLPSLAEVEDRIIDLINEFGTPGVKVTLAGSGVATFDMRFIRASMPRLLACLNYWAADVGVLRREWLTATGDDLVTVNKDKPHTGIDDARIHVDEARAFRHMFARLADLAGGGTLEDINALLEAVERQRMRDLVVSTV
jgi:oligoribonuclease